MNENKNVSLGKIGLSLYIAYFIVIFSEMVLMVLQIIPDVNTNSIDIAFPIIFWAKFAFAFFGVLLFMISLVISRKTIEDPTYAKTISIIRNLSIGIAIIVPLSVFYYMLAGVAAWGDIVAGAFLFTAGNLVTQGLLLLPFFIWHYRNRKTHDENRTNIIKNRHIIFNLSALGMFTVIYLISTYVYFELLEFIPGFDVLFVSIIFGVQFVYGCLTIVFLIRLINHFEDLVKNR